jgi:hypothetical protein
MSLGETADVDDPADRRLPAGYSIEPADPSRACTVTATTCPGVLPPIRAVHHCGA